MRRVEAPLSKRHDEAPSRFCALTSLSCLFNVEPVGHESQVRMHESDELRDTHLEAVSGVEHQLDEANRKKR